MGYFNNGNSYYPDDTESCFYFNSELNNEDNVLDIINKAKQKWGDDINLSDLKIQTEMIETKRLKLNSCETIGILSYSAYLKITYNRYK